MTKELEIRIAQLEAKVDLLATLIGRPSIQQTSARQAPAIERLRELTPKQNAACQLIWYGYSTEAMGAMMGATIPTLKVHIKGAMRKLEYKTRAQIALLMDEVMNTTDEAMYERVTGIPMQWGEAPDRYPDITKMIRTKTR